MRRALLVLPLVLASVYCVQPIETATACDEGGLRRLAERYIAAYNAGDLAGTLAPFSFDADGRGATYADALAGGSLQLSERSMLSRYLESRFALGERIALQHFEVSRDAATATLTLTRTLPGAASPANAKLVCSNGALSGMVMSASELPGDPCPLSPISSVEVNGYRLWGKRDDAVFFYLYPVASEAPLPRLHKFLIFLPGATDAPPTVLLRAVALTSPRALTVDLPKHYSEYGVEWGGTVDFGAAGCWWLEASGAGRSGAVVVMVG